jgi:uncharacterized protein (TIGR02246 family)
LQRSSADAVRPLAGALATLALACPVPLASAHAQAPAGVGAVDDAADDAAVRSVWSTLDALWNARNAEGFSEAFAVDGRFEFVGGGESMTGRSAIRRTFAARFPNFAPDIRHRTTVREVHFIAPSIRTLDGTVEILRIGAGPGGDPTVVRTFAIFAVMIRLEDGWRIRELRAYQLAAPEQAGTSTGR